MFPDARARPVRSMGSSGGDLSTRDISSPRDATLSTTPSAVSNGKGEVQGFVLWISSYVTFSIFLLWAFIPETLLHRFEVYYYPAKYWALAMPAYLCTTVVLLLLIYISLNLCMTNDLKSQFTYTDKLASIMTKKPRRSTSMDFEEIRDIPLSVVNKILYQSRTSSNSIE